MFIEFLDTDVLDIECIDDEMVHFHLGVNMNKNIHTRIKNKKNKLCPVEMYCL